MIPIGIPPDNKAIAKAIEISDGNLDALQYLDSEYRQIVTKFKLFEESKIPLEAITENIDLAVYTAEQEQPIRDKLKSGDLTENDIIILKKGYFNSQDLLASKKLNAIDRKVLSEQFKNVDMVYEINDKSEFTRAYVKDGKQLGEGSPDEAKVIDLLDEYFRVWLVSQGMSSQKGIIYSSTKLDKENNYIEKISPESFIESFEDPSLGFSSALKLKNKSIAIEVSKNEPQPKKEAQASVQD
jgi:hypothetical protein